MSSPLGKRIETIPESEMAVLQAYSWPGNVRELENVIERAVILAQSSDLDLGDWQIRPEARAGKSGIATLDEVQRGHILAAIEATAWVVSGEKGAARLLGLKPTTLDARMKRLGIHRKSGISNMS